MTIPVLNAAIPAMNNIQSLPVVKEWATFYVNRTGPFITILALMNDTPSFDSRDPELVANLPNEYLPYQNVGPFLWMTDDSGGLGAYSIHDSGIWTLPNIGPLSSGMKGTVTYLKYAR